MFEYLFMQRAFIAGIALGLAIPCVGVIVVMKHLSMVGDAFSHASLAGVAAGLVAGFDPLLGSALGCVAAAGAIEFVRKRFAGREELAIAIILALAVGLAGVLSGFAPNAASFSSYLFGSIVAVSSEELTAVVAVSCAGLLFCWIGRRQLMLVSIDEVQARLAGVRVGVVNAAFVLVCALVVAVGARTVGVLIISSMMVVPVATALLVARSWRQLVALSCTTGLVMSLVGLVISYVWGLRPGGTIVLVGIVLLALVGLVSSCVRRARQRQLA